MEIFVVGTYLYSRSEIAESAYDMFDKNKRGYIEFVDFAETISLCSSSDQRKRLKCIL